MLFKFSIIDYALCCICCDAFILSIHDSHVYEEVEKYYFGEIK